MKRLGQPDAAWPGRAGRQQGFTLFELVLVIVLVAVFSGVLLKRFTMYQEMAEKAGMEQTAGVLRSALHLQMAGLITRGRIGDIPKLAEVNPFSLLAERQHNYVGEYFDPKDIPTGSWYYDLKNRQVVYLVHRDAHFSPNLRGECIVRFQIVPVYNAPLPGEAATVKELGGITLREVEPYQWDIR
ncbi:prepilin-type N-terminal cleavage/methylation domain-containing protein [Oxalobacteraceae bacterium OM1]|nr:prepilin-type N-terminal cleavage/methylation domain-containing protein [Oxalobacteraceae bacterium OM1]